MRRFFAPFVALALAAAPSVAQTNSGFSFSFPVQTTTTLKLALTVNGSPYDLNSYLASGGSAMFQMVWATGSGTVHIVNASSVGVNSGDPTNVASIVITSSQVNDTAKWAATFVAGNQTWTGTVLTLPFGSAASATTNGVVTAAVPPAATATTVGGVVLSGDLSGTATVPQVVASHLAAPLPQGQGGSGAATLGAGTVTATGESTARALADKLGDVVSVKGFPGVSCNGINDDAAGLASAGTAANTAGASLLVNCKVRIASAAGTISAPLKFEGSGALDVSPVGGSVTITGALLAPTKQIFFSGSGTLTFSAKVAQVVPQWWGAVGDGVADDTAAIQAAITAAQAVKGTLRFPAGTFKDTANLSIATSNIVGEGPDQTILDFYGTGVALTFNGGNGNRVDGLELRSKGATQSGFLLSGGTGATVHRMRILDFDTTCFQAGVVDVSGVYFSNLDYIECNNTNTAGTTGVIVDGGGVSISSNASTFRNVFVKGKWATLYDVRGNDNIFIGGDAEMNNSAATITQTYKVSGAGNKFHDTYMEQIGATFPTTLVNFTSTSVSNVFDGIYLTATGVKNLDATIANVGTGNEFRPGPIGSGFPAQGRSTSPQNLLANSGFASMRTATLPLAYTDIFGTGTISRDTITVRGSAYSMKLDVVAARAGIAAYVATNNAAARLPIDPVPVAKLRGQTVTASVWVNSNAASVGALKVFDGTSNLGSAVSTGSGNWELLTVTAKVLTTALEVGIQLRTDSDGTAKTGTVYFSEPQIVIGNEAPYSAIRPLNDYAASLTGRMTWAPASTLTNNSTQPSVLDGNFFLASNSVGTSITTFLNGQSGQEIKLLTTNGNTTLVNGATLVTTTGANKLLTTSTVYKLIYDGTKWWEF